MPSIRGHQQRGGRLSGLVTRATGVLSSQEQRGRSKKGPVAVAVAAGAAGIAVLKRRRSNAANEPLAPDRPSQEAKPTSKEEP